MVVAALIVMRTTNTSAAAEYGKIHAGARGTSLVQVLCDPDAFNGKRISIWGVVGGYQERPTLFLTHDHARWKDVASGVWIEPSREFELWKIGPDGWAAFFGKSVGLQGRVVSEKMGDQMKVTFVVEYVFVPEDDRQTGIANRVTPK